MSKQLSNQAAVRTRRFGQEFIFKQIHLTGLFRWGGLADPAETDAGDAVCPAEAEMDSLEGADAFTLADLTLY